MHKGVKGDKAGRGARIPPANIFENYSVGEDMYACVNPYDKENATPKSRKNACKKGGFARKGFDGAFLGLQPCTEECNY